MLLRACFLLFLGLFPYLATGGIPASGGEWTRYEAPASARSLDLLKLRKQGKNLQVSGSYRLKVDLETGAADYNPRAAFDPETDAVLADGDAPVFLSYSLSDPNRAISRRDWFTGEVAGSFEIPPGISGSSAYLDELGVILYNGRNLAKTGLDGGNPSVVPMTTYGAPSAEIAASERWITISFRTESFYRERIEIFDRSTLAYINGMTPRNRKMAAFGNLMACVVGRNLAIYELPSLTLRASLSLGNDEFNPDFDLLDLEMVEGGMWLLLRATNAIGAEFTHYDLTNPTEPKRTKSLPLPAQIFYGGSTSFVPIIAGKDFVGFAANDKSTWIWTRKQGGPLAKVVPTGIVREGQIAGFKVVLSEPLDGPAQVSISARGATAVEGRDFAAFSTTLTIPAGATESAEHGVTILEDTQLEGNESFLLEVGATSGCVVEDPKVPVVITANGYNTHVHRRFQEGGKFWFENVWGSDGTHLIGTGTKYPKGAGDYSRTVVVNTATGAIVSEMPGASLYNVSSAVVQDGIFFAQVLDSAYSWEVPSGRVIGVGVESGGRILGPLGSKHMLVRKYSPDRLVVAKLGDGSQVAAMGLSNSEASVVIGRDIEGLPPGSAILALEDRTNTEGQAVKQLRVLDPVTLAPLRTFTWPAFHPQLGPYPKLKQASGNTLIFEAPYSVIAMDAVTGEWRWSLPLISETGLGAEACISGDLLLTRGTALDGGLYETGQYRFIDLKSGAVLENQGFEDLSGKPMGVIAFTKTTLQATPEGFLVVAGGQAVSVATNPTRPNVNLQAEAFEDNRTGELKLLAKEKFIGSYTMAVAEYVESLEDLPEASRLIASLPRQVEFTVAGTSLPLDCRRPAKGAEPISIRAMHSHLPGEAAGFRRTTVTNHVDPVSEQPFFTGQPWRNSWAAASAMGGDVVAFGYPSFPDAFADPSGAVDLYNRSNGNFIRTILPPASAAKMAFGYAVGITSNRIVIGAPGTSLSGSSAGRIFVYDLATGALVEELKLKGAKGLGVSIAANASWIAIGAPGTALGLPPTGRGDRNKPLPGTVTVFDATTLKPRYKVKKKGEMLGWSLALDGDTLFVGSPLASVAKPVKAEFAGVVRPYALPRGKSKGKALPILGSVRPVPNGHFGLNVAASPEMLAVFSTPALDGKKAVQVHRRSNLSQAAVFHVPGTDLRGNGLYVTDDFIFSGSTGENLRIFDLDDQRPEASYQIPYLQSLVADAEYFYWADTRPHRAKLPSSSGARSFAVADGDPSGNPGDLNHDGAINAIDRLLAYRGPKGMPVEILSPMDGNGTRLVRFLLDSDLPDNAKVSVEFSTDLMTWTKLLSWDSGVSRWRDGDRRLIGPADMENEAWEYAWEPPGGGVFFRTSVD